MLKKVFMFVALAAIAAAATGPARAQSTSSLEFTGTYGTYGATANDGVQWTVTSDGTESTFDNTKGIHYGTNSAQVQYIQLSTSGIQGTITQVVVNASKGGSSTTATVSVTVGGYAFGGAAQSLTTDAANYTFTGSAEGAIVVTVQKPSAATRALYVKSVTVTYTTSGGSSESVQLTLGSNNIAMGRATVVLHPEYELYDTYTTSSSTNGTNTGLYGYGVPVVDNAWINTSTSGAQSIFIDPNSSEVNIHHLTIFNANNDSAEVESSGYEVGLYFKNSNVYREYTCNELLLTGGVTRIKVYGMEMVLPAGVTATATAGVYDVVAGTQVPVAAVARTHHYLTGWSNSQTNDTITVTVSAATTLTANFAASPVLTLAVNNAQMGSVEIPRHQGYGLLFSIKAADYAGQTGNNDNNINGYYFYVPTVAANSTEWTNNEDYGQQVSVSAGPDSTHSRMSGSR